MSTRCSVYHHDGGDGSPRIHIYWELNRKRFELEVVEGKWRVVVPLPEDFMEYFKRYHRDNSQAR